MKIDKKSLAQPKPSRQAASSPTRDVVSRQAWTRRFQPTSLAVLVTLLVCAFGAGILVARLVGALPSSPSLPLSPLPPTSIPPTPTPAPTPTPSLTEAGDALETLYLDIPPAGWEKIVAKRQEALQLGILLVDNDDYVPATLRLGHNPTEVPVQVRLKGDWLDHIAYDKWSFRVRTVDENYVLGMRVFSLQDPSTRSFLNEWLFLEHLRREGVLAVRYHFVHVVLNGTYKGIYALEEGFAKELFEAQGRREGLIIRYDEDLVWEYRAFYDDQLIPRGVNQFYVIDEFQSGRVADSPLLSAQRDAAIGLLRALLTDQRAAPGVFDLETMGKFLALSDFWSAPHGLIWHNLRYYYNPITTRLEPIAFDSHALVGDLEMVGLPPSAFYRDPYLKLAYVRALAQIIQPGYVADLEAQLGAQFKALRAALAPEIEVNPRWSKPEAFAPPWDGLRRRQELLRQTLDPYQTVYAYVQRPAAGSELVIDVGNLLDLPLEIVGLEFDGERLSARRDWVVPSSDSLLVPASEERPDALILRALAPDANFMDYARLRVRRSALPEASEIKIVTRLWGLEEEHVEEVLPGYPSPLAQGPRPETPTLAQALAQHPYLRRDDPIDPIDSIDDESMDDEGVEGKWLRVEPGSWQVNGDLILPAGYGLRLKPGTTLRFGPDNFLLSGGPLDFQGAANAPVLLGPSADAWKGIVVLEAGAPSTWNYVTVERAAAIDRQGWTLTGGVTFYDSPISLENCRLLDSQAEDAINVIQSHFEFIRSEFAGSVSDAFDADFGQGIVEDCSFHDVGGDGVDVSGSEVEVRRLKLLDVGDKGISVGENSRLAAYDVHFENVGFALVSKDLSHATLQGATIVNPRQAGLAAYVKKAAYGPASLSASGVRFVDTPPERRTLVQTGSWLDLEGSRVWGTDVDVDALYPQ